MNPNRHFGLVSRGLFAGAALLVMAPAALAQNDPIKAIPEPEVAAPKGLDAQQQPAPQTQAPAPVPVAAPAAANAYVPSDETRKLTGKKLIEAPIANLSGTDAAVAEKIREILAAKSERIFSNK